MYSGRRSSISSRNANPWALDAEPASIAPKGQTAAGIEGFLPLPEPLEPLEPLLDLELRELLELLELDLAFFAILLLPLPLFLLRFTSATSSRLRIRRSRHTWLVFVDELALVTLVTSADLVDLTVLLARL